jgi:threonine/homoserine/homoserine lactone efflux protein
MMAEALAFLGVCALVICTPGPDTALTVRNSIIGGRRVGVLTAGGIAAGQMVWTVAASVGIAGLLQASQPAFTALKIIGAAYLVFLGAQSILAAIRGNHGNEQRRMRAPELAPWRAMRQGFISNLANPKDGGFLPQPAASVRVANFWQLRRIRATRAGVLPHDLRLALDLRRGSRSDWVHPP